MLKCHSSKRSPVIILSKREFPTIIYFLAWNYATHSFVYLLILCLPYWNVSSMESETLSFLYLTVCGAPLTVPDHGSVQFSRSVMSDSLRPHELQHARPPCPSPSPGVHSNSRPSNWWCHPAISSCCPLLLLPPIPPSITVFSNESTLHEVAKVLEFQPQHQSFQWTPRTGLL